MNLEVLDKNTANRVHEELMNATKAILAKYGMTMTKGTGNFSPTEMNLRITARVAQAAVKIADTNAPRLDMMGFTSEFVRLPSGMEYRLVKPNRGRKSWEALDREGKSWKLRSETVETYFRNR